MKNIKFALAFFAFSLSVWSGVSAAGRPVFGGNLRDEVGVNIHFTDPHPGEMEELSEGGFGLIRMDFVWASTEKTLGVYDFSAYDRLMNTLSRYHIRPLWILDYGNPLYENGANPTTDATRNAFAKWAAAAVTHFKGHRVIWEMWNEPNPNWASDYAKLALATGLSIKTTAPNETYIGPAEAGTNPAFLEQIFKTGVLNYWDAVSVHPYRSTAPDEAAQELSTIQALIAKYEPAGKSIPLLSGEWGYSVMPSGNTYSYVTSDEQQAEYFDREVLSNQQSGLPITIWYDWHDDSPNASDTEGNFGLVRNPYNAGHSQVFDPKPAYVAAKTLLTLLGDYHFKRTIPVPGSTTTRLYEFDQHRDRAYAVYSTAGSPEVVDLPLPPGHYAVTTIMGNNDPSVTAASNGIALFNVNGSTKIITSIR